MMCSQPENYRFTSAWRRNLVSVVVSVAALGLLFYQIFPTDFGTEAKNIEIEVYSLPIGSLPIVPAVYSSVSGSAQAAIADKPPRTLSSAADSVPTGKLALLMNLLLLERGQARLAEVADYTATFIKQERIGNEISQPQVMRLKIRHQPFSVYLKWLRGDKGREVIYIAGRNDGNLLVHVGGWKARLLPTVKLDPNGSLAMQESRHPLTDIGLLEVVRRSLGYRQRDLDAESGVRCQMLDNQTFDDRDCYCFTTEYDDSSLSEGNRKTVVYLDKEMSLPVSVTNYGWPPAGEQFDPARLDEMTLIEAYSYSNIELDQQLTDIDFDRNNKKYRFR